ncbi:hypothetical protein A0J61_03671 [Choanephora cucurbitarum]|uniref:Uncharacterized protein n=1 Tax=Choanephora cucurbitarum TaxID=101091 RepID=A0A1C7NGQ6_9FUNG|nr:hypothetical protein A0J61_03671 [Choanephora cucurbitarum]
MNNYLRPLVDELLVLMNGVTMNTRNNRTQTVAGFTSFKSKHPCHKCKKEFGEFLGTKNHARDFDDFEDDNWVKRTCEEHRAQANTWRMTPIKARRKRTEG